MPSSLRLSVPRFLSRHPPLTHPDRGPPQTELTMGPGGGQAEEVAQESSPDDLDQTPNFDPAEPEPIPDDNFDETWGA